MDWRAACTAVIPCLNEEAAIGSVVGSVRKHVASVMVIDDGSNDGTSTRAESAGALVLNHPSARGKGAALQTGWTRARAQGFRWALMMDGDGQHSPEDIPAFFRCAERTGASLVVGNRLGEAGHMPFLRRLVNRWMSADISQLAGRDLPDSQCGFRLMNLEDWARLPMVSNHFEIESEMLCQLRGLDFPSSLFPSK